MHGANSHTAVFGNTWGGRRLRPHLKELERYNAVADVCFFAEVHHFETTGERAVRVNHNPKEPPLTINQYDLMIRKLQNFDCHLTPARAHAIACQTRNVTYANVGFGNVRAFRNSAPVLDHGSPTVFGTLGEKSTSGVNPRALDYAVIGGPSGCTIVAHLHGLWIEGNTKGDAPERDEQSEGVRRVLRILSEQYSTDRIILGGDFNLNPNTAALRHLEEGDGAEDIPLRNLIREYEVTSTRTRDYRHYDEPGYSLFADYVLVSEAIEVIDFAVLEKSASDHMHLMLTWYA